MVEYNLVMSVIGPVVLFAIFVTWDLTRKVERLRLGTRKVSVLILIGGIITALGFVSYVLDIDRPPALLFVMLGPVLITYSLSESGLVQPKFEMLVQIALMVGSIGLSANKMFYTMLMFSAVSVLLLIDAVAFYRYTPSPQRHFARLASWLLVAFTVVNAVRYGCTLAFVLYVLSIIIWVSTLISLEFYLKDMDKTAQEGL